MTRAAIGYSLLWTSMTRRACPKRGQDSSGCLISCVGRIAHWGQGKHGSNRGCQASQCALPAHPSNWLGSGQDVTGLTILVWIRSLAPPLPGRESRAPACARTRQPGVYRQNIQDKESRQEKARRREALPFAAA